VIPDCELLRRFLRQRLELGETELFLESLTPEEAIAFIRPGSEPRAGGVPDWRTVLSDAGIGAERPVVALPSRPIARPGSAPPAPAGPSGARVDLRVLAAEAAGCTRCRLHEGRRNVVFGEGNPEAELVVVGEAPGGEEDRTGRPFVGPAGKLLDLLLLSAGFPRDRVYICNVLKCRPPNNRDPQRDEVERCSEYLHRQLEAIAPRVLLAVGKFAAQTLAGSEASIGKLRGRIHTYRGTPTIATYHPAFLLRSPQWMRAAWKDFQFAREVLDAQRSGGSTSP
jgi:DNA polymerase